MPVNLSKDGYMEALEKATKDITVQIVVNNAGYILTGFYTSKTVGTGALYPHPPTTHPYTLCLPSHAMARLIPPLRVGRRGGANPRTGARQPALARRHPSLPTHPLLVPAPTPPPPPTPHPPPIR